MSTANPTIYSAVSTNENQDSPPGYFDIVNQLKNIKTEANSPQEILQKTYGVACNSFLFTIFLGISIALPVAMLVVGVLNREECPMETKIPLWLIVMGAGGIVSGVIKFVTNIVSAIKARKGGQAQEPCVVTCVNCLLSIAILVWFILGNYWVYKNYNNVKYDKDLFPEQYCSRLVYLFSFWSITASWITLGVMCLCCVCLLACVCGCSILACKSANSAE